MPTSGERSAQQRPTPKPVGAFARGRTGSLGRDPSLALAVLRAGRRRCAGARYGSQSDERRKCSRCRARSLAKTPCRGEVRKLRISAERRSIGIGWWSSTSQQYAAAARQNQHARPTRRTSPPRRTNSPPRAPPVAAPGAGCRVHRPVPRRLPRVRGVLAPRSRSCSSAILNARVARGSATPTWATALLWRRDQASSEMPALAA